MDSDATGAPGPESGDFASGRRLGRYEILGTLGKGGMGEVYEALDPSLGRRVALKVLPPGSEAHSERFERFRREAKLVAALDHPGIVTIYGLEEHGGRPVIVMERIVGRTLDEVINGRPLPLPTFFDLAIPLIEAVAAAHERGVMHRDIKPANIMVTDDGRVRVLDFGLAKLKSADTEQGASTAETELRTTEGAIVGTAAYMSPEQAMGRKVTRSSDQFSIGVVLYQMLTGRHPFTAESLTATLASILRDEPADIVTLRHDLPDGLGNIVSRCLAKNPHERYPSVDALAREIEAVRESPDPYRPSKSGELLADPEAPWVAVRGFSHAESDPELVAFSQGLTDDISTLLSRFPYLLVASTDGESAHDRSSVHYQLQGSVRRAGSALRVNVQLIEKASGRQLWAERFDRDLDEAGIFDIQDDLTHRIVATVADGQGVLSRSIAARTVGREPEDLNPYEALVRVFVYAQHITPEEHLPARRGLELAVERRPSYAEAWAALAMLTLDEYRMGFNPRPDSLERATQAADRAVNLDPSSQLAHRALAEIHISTGDLEAFRLAADRALELNPYDTENVAGLGLYIATTGDWERGLAICERAMELNSRHPDWYRFPQLYDLFRRGRYEEALEVAKTFNMPGFFWMHLVYAAIYAELGRDGDAQREVDALLALVPDFTESGPVMLDQFVFGDLREQFIAALRKAGLELEPGPER